MSRISTEFVIMAMLMALASISIHSVRGQFFTKTANSIPRMGRRNDPSMAPMPNPDLLNYWARSLGLSARSNARRTSSNLDNDEPNLSTNYGREPVLDYDNGKYEQLAKWLAANDKRSIFASPSITSGQDRASSLSSLSSLPSSSSSSSGPLMIRTGVPNDGDTLAMRALYLDRLRNQISSGQQYNLMTPRLAPPVSQ